MLAEYHDDKQALYASALELVAISVALIGCFSLNAGPSIPPSIRLRQSQPTFQEM
jgi:hypothetical protein